MSLDTVGAEVGAAAAKRSWKWKAVDSTVTGYERIMGAIAGLPSYTDGTVYVSGSAAVSSIVGKLLIKDLALLFPVVVAVIALILLLSFRTARGVFMPLGNVVLSVVWAMGLMGLRGQAITMATMVLPVILIAVGTAYTIHVINRFYEDLATIADKKEAIASTVSHVALPVFLAGVTTMTGFSSLAASSIPAMRMFGILSALGILFALILSLTLTPALLAILPVPKARTVRAHDESKLTGFLVVIGRFVAQRPVVTVFVCLGLIAGIGVFASRVSFETNTLNSFKKGTEIRQASEYLNENYCGITVMAVVVRTDGANPIVGGSQSIVTLVKGINKTLNADDPAYDKVPDDMTPVPVGTGTYAYHGGVLTEFDSETMEPLAGYASGDDLRVEGGYGYLEIGGIERKVDLATGGAVELIPGRVYAGQLVFQYENSGDLEDIEGFIDNPRRTARVNVFIKSASSSVVRQVQAKARAAIAELFPAGSRADITGLSDLTIAILRLLVQTQIGSVLASLVICFLFISLVSRNLVEGLFSILPLTGALLIDFGSMAIFGIPIDISTVTIASIGIGIRIDYTRHFLDRLKLSLRTHDLPGAIELTMRTTGKGIFVNALAVAGGFAALLASQLRGNIFMGLLMAMIMLTSSTFEVTLMPALLRIFNPGFLYKRASGNRKPAVVNQKKEIA
jgi:predicted RND superfamily exporter protein